MNLLKITFVLLFLIISVGFVSAQDPVNDTLETDHIDTCSTDELGTFKELSAGINNATGTFEITKDYERENNTIAVIITNDNLTINGNNHIIDGKNRTIFFNYASNVTINDLIFRNGHVPSSGSALYNFGTIILNNVTFINNSANEVGGAIYNYGGELNVCGAVFTNNTAKYGGAVYNDGGVMNLESVVFTNNAANEGGAVCNNGVMNLDGVVFTNNVASDFGGAICGYLSFACRNSKFRDNIAEYGNAIVGYGVGRIDIDNCSFESKYENKFGFMFLDNSGLSVNNSIFSDSSAMYAAAVYADLCPVITINNTQFINLKADKTGGAVIIKHFENVTIENSKFINTSSANNGGAVFIDLDNLQAECPVNICNASFINSSSGFGGAYLQLSGNLTIFDSQFINCSSKYDGGAAYLSNVMAEIDNTLFISNKIAEYDDYPTYGGAIYLDCSDIYAYGLKFINNSARDGSGAIAIYQGSYHIENSTLDNGEAIHATFKDEGSEVIDCSGNYTICDENVFYPQVVINQGKNLTLIANEINADTLPTRFDLRDFNWTSPVRNQGWSNACWVFAHNSVLESALLKSFGLNVNISISLMRNAVLAYSKYGSLLSEGGDGSYVAHNCLSWLGPISEEFEAFDEFCKISPLFTNSTMIHLQDVVILDKMDTNATNGDSSYKQAILKYGGIYCNIYGISQKGEEYEYYDFETFAQYNPNPVNPNHAICIVGWDDTFPADNFGITPPGDGAWICKNSWGTHWGDGGYFYVSYYDKTIAQENHSAFGFIFENTISYNKNYQYDFTGLYVNLELDEGDEGYGKPITYANKFKSVDDDLMAAVGTYFNQSGVNYTIDIEVNGKIVLSQEGISPYSGYHTIKLDNYVPIKKGDEFIVYVTSNIVPLSYSPRIEYESNVSMVYLDRNWVDAYVEGEYVTCIKAYTVGDDSKITRHEDISVNYGDKSFFTVKVATGDGIAVCGAVVNFTINGKTISAVSDSEGIASLEIKELPGNYAVTATYNNGVYKNNVTVVLDSSKSKLVSKDIKVDYAGGSYFTVKAVSSDGKVPIIGKQVIIVFNGKTYTKTTDSKGIAKIKITDVPKKYTVTTIYNGKTYKNTVTVKQVLTASKVTLKKTSKKFTLKARLKINGKLVKGKWITFKFNGKTYKAKTNSKGIAQKTFNKNIIKKLKKGKTYTVKVTYSKDTIKTAVKVR